MVYYLESFQVINNALEICICICVCITVCICACICVCICIGTICRGFWWMLAEGLGRGGLGRRAGSHWTQPSDRGQHHPLLPPAASTLPKGLISGIQLQPWFTKILQCWPIFEVLTKCMYVNFTNFLFKRFLNSLYNSIYIFLEIFEQENSKKNIATGETLQIITSFDYYNFHYQITFFLR